MWTAELTLTELRRRADTLRLEVAYKASHAGRKQRAAIFAALPIGVAADLSVRLLEHGPGVSVYELLLVATAAAFFFGLNWSAATDKSDARISELRLEQISDEISRRADK